MSTMNSIFSHNLTWFSRQYILLFDFIFLWFYCDLIFLKSVLTLWRFLCVNYPFSPLPMFFYGGIWLWSSLFCKCSSCIKYNILLPPLLYLSSICQLLFHCCERHILQGVQTRTPDVDSLGSQHNSEIPQDLCSSLSLSINGNSALSLIYTILGTVPRV